MLQSHRRLGFVLSLASGTAGAIGFHENLLLQGFDVGIVFRVKAFINRSYMLSSFWSARCWMTRASTMKNHILCDVGGMIRDSLQQRLTIIRCTARGWFWDRTSYSQQFAVDLVVQPVDEIIPFADGAGELGVAVLQRRRGHP